jgi:outer membrane protein OmpA-like peptidoglycan-associated protein
MAEARSRLRSSAWWVALVAGLVGVLVTLVFFAQRRPESAGRETTTTRAEIAREAGVQVMGAAGSPCASHISCAEGALCTRGSCEPITSATTECRHVMVRFARGTSALSSFAQAEVERVARCLQAHRDVALSIEPSSDVSRTSNENEALTIDRRAAVRDALDQRGVSREQLKAVGLLDRS